MAYIATLSENNPELVSISEQVFDTTIDGETVELSPKYIGDFALGFLQDQKNFLEVSLKDINAKIDAVISVLQKE